MSLPRNSPIERGIQSIEFDVHRKSSDVVGKYLRNLQAITVIGGGRWARVLASELCFISSSSVKITVCSPRNSNGMSNWAASTGIQDRISTISGLPSSFLKEQGAVIVVNEVRHHVEAAQRAIFAGVPTLVEKPLALTGSSVHSLIENALRGDVRFAAAHVFRYASYLEEFEALVSGIGQVNSIRLVWTEPRFEMRFGEQKAYDPGVPIFMDLLPHILSIVRFVTPGPFSDCRLVHFNRGGAEVELEFTSGETLCSVALTRNGDRRRRQIRVETEQETIELDFTKEPGTVLRGSKMTSGDPHWERGPHPVARMLTAFLEWSSGGEADSRLDVTFGARACEMSDDLINQYRLARKEWLDSQCECSSVLNEDLRYSLREMLHFENQMSRPEIDRRLEYVERNLTELFGSNLAKELANKVDPEQFVKTIIR